MGFILVPFPKGLQSIGRRVGVQETLCISSGQEIIPSSLLFGDIFFLNVNTLSLALLDSN